LKNGEIAVKTGENAEWGLRKSRSCESKNIYTFVAGEILKLIKISKIYTQKKPINGIQIHK